MNKEHFTAILKFYAFYVAERAEKRCFFASLSPPTGGREDTTKLCLLNVVSSSVSFISVDIA